MASRSCLPATWVFAALMGAAACGGSSSEDPCARASGCIDVCQEANPCAADATCTTTPEAVACTCKSGFTGDGFSCTDVDECADGTDNCDVAATCDNSAGSFTCTCLPLYSGDGVTCSPPPSTWSILGGARRGNQLAVDATGIYAIGEDPFEYPSGTTYRLEKRSTDTGDRIWWTSGFTEFNAVATDGTSVFVAGTKKEVGYNRYRWWIQGFAVADGMPGPESFLELTSGTDRVKYLAVHSDSLYAFGEVPKNASTSATRWHLQKHLRSSLAVTWSVAGPSENSSTLDDLAGGLAVDDTGVYIAGTPENVFAADRAAWQIEKRSLVDGSVIWSQASNPSPLADYVRAVAVDATGVYVGGNDYDSTGSSRWRIEKRALDTGILIWSKTFDEPSDGGVVGASGIPSIRSIAADSSGVYVFGQYRPGGNTFDWKFKMLSTADGSVIWEQDGALPHGRTPGGIAVDPRSLYLVGTEGTSYKFEKRHKSTGGL